jgi:Fe-S cluster assembly iron-binding protein IscA
VTPIRGKEFAMLQVTDAAVSVLKSAILQESQSRDGERAMAIRIKSTATDDGRRALGLEAVRGPEPGDAPAESSDLDVFVAPELATPLDHSILDAQTTAEGSEILLRDQP